jgi:hypothetical protein
MNAMIPRAIVSVIAITAGGFAQSFDSGSSGRDGALVLTTPGVITFDPHALQPALNPSGDNIYHFTSIYVAKGVTVKLSAKLLDAPIFWLAQGSVQIDGVLDLDGANGEATSALAGSGGYFGGAAQQPGYKPGDFKSNIFLVPLVGGSGGDGGETGGGGAGGGALLIASSTGITVNGSITANGGASIDGVGGNGGSIRLVSPGISGTGVISAKGGPPAGTDGLVRFETILNEFSGGLSDTPFALGKPFGLFLPSHPPGSVRVVSIGGVLIGAPDSTISESAPVAVVIEARFIPPGTVVRLELFSERGTSQMIATTSLEGTFQLSRAMATVTFPPGSLRNHLRASWTEGSRSQQKK